MICATQYAHYIGVRTNHLDVATGVGVLRRISVDGLAIASVVPCATVVQRALHNSGLSDLCVGALNNSGCGHAMLSVVALDFKD